MDKIFLKKDDLIKIANIAARRQDNKEDNNVESKKWTTSMSEFCCHYEGVITEYAAMLALGLLDAADQMEKLEELFYAGDGGWDFEYNGRQCDVKKVSWTKRGEVLIINPPGPKALITIGCRITGPTCIDVIGVIGEKAFMENKQDHNFGYGDRFFVPVEALAELDMLRNLKPA